MNKTTLAGAITASLLATTLSAQAHAGNGFISDSSLTLGLRNFYHNQDQRSGNPGFSRSEEWGQGFLLQFQSGWVDVGSVKLGLDALGQYGLRLDGGGRAGKSGITRRPGQLFPLESDGRAASEFGRFDLTGKVQVAETTVHVGVLRPRLPVLASNDGRLLPQTFRGGQLVSRDVDGLTLQLGQIERASGRASTDYENLRIAGGSERVNQFRFVGGDYQLNENLTTSYYFGQLQDYYRQHFLGVRHRLPLGDGRLDTDLRYFDSNAYGANRNGAPGFGGKVDNRAVSALFTYHRSGHSLGLGRQHMSGNSSFPFVNNGDGAIAYLITDSQIGKFLRAGQRTWVAEYAYDFAEAGIPGLRASAKYLRGDNVSGQPSGQDKERERDLRVDYTVQEGLLKNLGLSVRHASLRSSVPSQRDIDEARIYLTYSFKLL
ncbi:OprD family porin [Halopseudomonas salegens]|uniref:Outer membrane porin, OprD family n=1 Tax=Halopseudomonas salegens TaxID=1434072 RepID=A0A1H2GZV1_9GAMM|nr:OprD family porin [Halopseudomonas salegens]SDU25071.1 outer membrane porin, OprD family [Halopseudomonas salegens]